MKAHQISESIFCLHADVFRTDSHSKNNQNDNLFEGIWPLTKGISLNSYIVKGDKLALIDLVRDWSEAPKQYEDELSGIGLCYEDVDYLIMNHLEPDHTGWLLEFKRRCPHAEIISTAKGINLVKSFYHIDTKVRVVKDGDTLDLGEGMVLQFFETPNIHWPETMVTWEPKSGTLFTCDAFGSFGALGDRVFDDQFNAEEHLAFEREALRYYTNIVSSFPIFVERAIEKLSKLEIKCIAPSHGMVWRTNPQKIIDEYSKFVSYNKGPGEKEITVIWGSIYGNTKIGVDAVIKGIQAERVPYTVYQIPDDNISYMIADAHKNAGLVLAMPTFEYAMFPPMAHVIDMLKRKHVFGKTVFRLGSWGWVGGAKKEYEAAIEPLNWNSVESVEWQGLPTEETLKILEEKGREIARKVKAL
jgi:flavorubredoxin